MFKLSKTLASEKEQVQPSKEVLQKGEFFYAKFALFCEKYFLKTFAHYLLMKCINRCSIFCIVTHHMQHVLSIFAQKNLNCAKNEILCTNWISRRFLSSLVSPVVARTFPFEGKLASSSSLEFKQIFYKFYLQSAI